MIRDKDRGEKHLGEEHNEATYPNQEMKQRIYDKVDIRVSLRLLSRNSMSHPLLEGTWSDC